MKDQSRCDEQGSLTLRPSSHYTSSDTHHNQKASWSDTLFKLARLTETERKEVQDDESLFRNWSSKKIGGVLALYEFTMQRGSLLQPCTSIVIDDGTGNAILRCAVTSIHPKDEPTFTRSSNLFESSDG